MLEKGDPWFRQWTHIWGKEDEFSFESVEFYTTRRHPSVVLSFPGTRTMTQDPITTCTRSLSTWVDGTTWGLLMEEMSPMAEARVTDL